MILECTKLIYSVVKGLAALSCISW